ncbi:50S ribosomal protein L10 [Patescibacteria group bacterium]|nr:MAG: 50S ribosomal protein L10 [Patescibacteria group bacterium]
MAVTKEKKKEIVARIKEALKDTKSLVFVNFHGLTVAAASELRRALRAAGVAYYVAKKNLVRRALEDTKVSGSMPEFAGELALAWGDDLVAPARGVYEFQKKNPENLKILGGIFEGRYLNQAEMMDIATIPPLPILHGKFVNIINSPIQRFVISLGEIAKTRMTN